MAFIDTSFLKSLGYRIPQSSIDNVNDLLNNIIENAEKEYFQNTIGYALTDAIYSLVEPYPDQVNIFLEGNMVDGDLFYTGIKREIAHFIMAMFYGQLDINVNNSGFSSPISDGEEMRSSNFIVNTCINKSRMLRKYSYAWLIQNNNDFFEDWKSEYFNPLESHPVW